MVIFRSPSPKSYILNPQKGFTIVEFVITLALFVVITGVGIYFFNPAGQLAGARNTQRSLHLQTILTSVRQNIADSPNGAFVCAQPLPTSTRRMTSVPGGSYYNIAPCLIPTYADSLPFDPSGVGTHYNSASDYDTGYSIVQATSGQITLSAPYAELGQTITLTR